MNDTVYHEARSLYREYRQTHDKIGEEGAEAQFLQNQSNSFFLILVDHWRLYSVVRHFSGQNDKIEQGLRSACRVLSNEADVQQHEHDIGRAVDCFDELEREISGARDACQCILHAFIFIRTRNDLARRLIRASPLEFDTYLGYLLQALPFLSTKLTIHLSDMIFAMIEEQPEQAPRIRYELTRQRVLPGLITRMTAAYCADDYAEYLTGVFDAQPNWFLAQGPANAVLFQQIKDALFLDVQRANGNAPRLALSYRAIVGMICFFGVKLNDKDIQQCLDLLQNPPSKALLDFGLCLVLVTEQMIKQARLRLLLAELLKRRESDLPLLILSFFQGNKIAQVEQTIRSVMNMPLPIAKIGLYEMQNLFQTIAQVGN
ncbi:hypothetical protein BC940DRAFT_302367 [Gongronella butleri]|nr:hypothetical protein BC940DRAFT_302367 [Gongronella butleri]